MMTDTKIDLNAYIHRQIHCSCGHTHYSGVRLIDIDRGAVRRLPGHIRELGYEKIFLVADRNTWRAAGKQAAQALTADGIIALEQKAGKNDVAKRDQRLAVIKEKWEEIRRAIQEDLPAAEEMAALLRSLGAPTEPEEIDIPAARAREAVVVAKEVRDRYTLLQLLWDLGLAEQYAASAE